MSLLDIEFLRLLLEILAVIALEWSAAASVHLEHPADHIVEEVAIVSDQQYGAIEVGQVSFEPCDGVCIEVIGRFVE